MSVQPGCQGELIYFQCFLLSKFSCRHLELSPEVPNRENQFKYDYDMVSFAVCIRMPNNGSLKANNIYVD